MPVKPMLGDLELQLVQQLEAAEHQERAQHAVPALEGDFLQALGRRASSFTLTGVLANEDGTVGEELKKLREKFRGAQPVEFVADIATAVRIDTVLIEEMSVRELAGKPVRFEYAFTLREYIPAPAPEEEPPPPPPPTPTTSLTVTVIVEGQPGFDFSQVQVTVRGTQDDGIGMDRTLTNRRENVWEEATFPPGNYRVIAVAPDPVEAGSVMANEAQAQIQEGEREEVTLVLTPGQRRNVAVAFVVHYWFDKAFIEPCLRPVLREVAQRAAGGQEKLLIVGHTDLTGSPEYNQALSERRSRGVHAFLTFKNNPDAAVAEWNELRKTRTVGVTNSLNDTWGVREYQYMLQDLGFYVGPINEKDDDNTKAAVRAFQLSKGLDDDGVMGDQTWPVLIRDYLAQDNLSLDDSVFFPNTGNNCDGGLVRWIGCGELDPVRNTQDAWRPNRRTEMLFVIADKIPCQAPRPVTWDIRPDGTTAPQWCLGPGDKNKPCCFLSRSAAASDKWLVQPAHPETVKISGRITFEDGVTPFANQRFSLLSPVGEWLHTNDAGKPDTGEVASGADRGRPIFDRTDNDGRYSYPTPTPVGVYILELPDVDSPQAARWADEPPSSARSNVICREVSAPSPPAKETPPLVGAKVGVGAPAGPTVDPHITLTRNFTLVKRTYTTPARVPVTLKSDIPFSGTGTFTAAPADQILFFKVPLGGAAIVYDGVDNAFNASDLTSPAGVKVFAEGVKASSQLEEVLLTLTLNPTPPPAVGPPLPPVGAPATAKMTAVDLALDVFQSRKVKGSDPDPFPQPPAVKPAPGAAVDKWFSHRLVHVQDGNRHRAILQVKVTPPAFDADLVLRNVKVNGDIVTGADTKIDLFDVETAGASKGNSTEFKAKDVPAAGKRFFAQGKTVSGGLRDSGFQVGVKGVEDDGDRVAFTVYKVDKITAHLRSTPCVNRAVAHDEDMPNKESTSDSRSFAAAFTLLRHSGDLRLTAAATPAATPIAWDVQRASDDANALKGLPKHEADGSDKKRKLKTDADGATGSFHVFAFVNSNSNATREEEEDGLSFNVNLVNAEIIPGAANNKVFGKHNLFNDARSSPATLVVDSGTDTNPPAADPWPDADYDRYPFGLKVAVKLTGGGGNQQRGTASVGMGYIQHTNADSVRGTYADGRTLREVIFADPPPPPGNVTGPNPATGLPFPTIAFPVRDHRQASIQGRGTFINSSSDTDQSPIPAGGQKRVVRMIDPPAIAIDRTHPVTGSALANISGSNDFEIFLVAFSTDYDENYLALAKAIWSLTYGSLNAAGNWTNVGANVVAPAQMTEFTPPKTGEATGLQRCQPSFTGNLRMDAT